jgi:Arc/MetJ-type ribon-helix-helix transcriptional regulator
MAFDIERTAYLAPRCLSWQASQPVTSCNHRRICAMIIHLSKDLEQIVHNAVLAGVYAGEDDVIRDALTRLERTLPNPVQIAGKTAKRAKANPQNMGPLSPDELNKRLLASGLVTRLPDPAQDIDDDDDDPPIVIRGEPLSETIIRERR